MEGADLLTEPQWVLGGQSGNGGPGAPPPPPLGPAAGKAEGRNQLQESSGGQVAFNM